MGQVIFINTRSQSLSTRQYYAIYIAIVYGRINDKRNSNNNNNKNSILEQNDNKTETKNE